MDRDSIPLERAQAISHGFSAGNFANAYISEDAGVASREDLSHYPESAEGHPEHDTFWYAWNLGFFASYEDHEIDAEGLEQVEDARGAIGPEILALGYIDPWTTEIEE